MECTETEVQSGSTHQDSSHKLATCLGEYGIVRFVKRFLSVDEIHEFEIEKKIFLLHKGTPLDDLAKVSKSATSLFRRVSPVGWTYLQFKKPFDSSLQAEQDRLCPI